MLYRSCYTGAQLTPGKILLLTFFYFFLIAGTAKRWPTKCDPLRRVGHPNAWQNAGFVCPRATLCGDRACRMGKHVLWWNANLLCPQQPSAEIVRVERPNMSWNANFFWARTTLCRDRVGQTSKHVAKCKFGEARRRPFARNEGQTSKTQNCDFLTSDAKVQELV